MDRAPRRLRTPPIADTVDATVDQIRQLVERLNSAATDPAPMFVFDAGYDAIALGHELADTHTQLLTRISPRRVFHPDPGPHQPRTIGRPRRHGPRFALSEPDTWTEPDTQLHTHDSRYGNIVVQAWTGLHPKLGSRARWAEYDQPPIVTGTVIRVEVEHLPKSYGRNKTELWLWWTGAGPCDLDVCWRAYLRRFDIEHSFRFAKNTLGLTTPSPPNPEQTDTWTWLIIAAYTQLRLARPLVNDDKMPWERPPPTRPTHSHTRPKRISARVLRQELVRNHRTLGVHCDNVGERAASVDPELPPSRIPDSSSRAPVGDKSIFLLMGRDGQ